MGKDIFLKFLFLLNSKKKNIVCILLLFMNEADTYAAVSSMIEVSRSCKWYFRLSKLQNCIFSETFNDLATRKFPSIMSRMFMVFF